jgi:hypothetical protein
VRSFDADPPVAELPTLELFGPLVHRRRVRTCIRRGWHAPRESR